MKHVSIRLPAVMIVNARILYLKLKSIPPSVSDVVNSIRSKVKNADNSGEMNQLARMRRIYIHPIEEKPHPTRPAPTSPPMTA